MMKKNIFLIFSLAIAMQQAGAQLISPDIISVSYNQADQKYYISWADKNTIIIPDTFKIYVFSGNYTGLGQPIYDPFESVDGSQITAAIDPQFTIGAKTYDLFNNVYSFAVEAFRTGKTPSTDNISRRPNLNAPNNILLNLKQKDFDTCNYTLTLTWNKYYGWPNSDGQKYQVSYGTAIGSLTNWNFNGTINTSDTSIVLPVNITNSKGQRLLFNTNYFFQIAVVNALAAVYPCSSNINSVNTNISAIPKFINADGTIIQNDNQHIQLSFTKDSISPMHKYNVLRSDNYGGPYIKIHSIDDIRNTIIYIDTVDALSKQYFYKLEVLINCGLKVGESDTASSIILKGQKNGHVINLNWNSYQKFEGKIRDYIIYRTMQGGPTISSTTTDTFTTDRSDTITEKGFLAISYYVVANEIDNPHGIAGFAQSNTVTIPVNQDIPMDDNFTPNGDGLHEIYSVSYGAYKANEFKFIIYDRWGTKVFETSNYTEGWNGKVNGHVAPQGAYIYYFKIVGSDNKIIEQRGSFLLLLPK